MAYPVSSLRSFLPSRDRPPPRTQAMRFNNSMPKEIMRANFNFMQVGRKGGGDMTNIGEQKCRRAGWVRVRASDMYAGGTDRNEYACRPAIRVCQHQID